MSINNLVTTAKDPTTTILGVDTEGKPVVANISDGPHWLIAGTTGSGKSVSVNSMIAFAMYHSTPDELQIFAVDPKKVEFGAYTGSPYFPVDPITDMGNAYGLLAYLVIEMDRRYAELEEYGFKNIHGFNKWVIDNPDKVAEINADIEEYNVLLDEGEEEKTPIGKMPFIICVIDEFAELMMDPNSQGCDELIVSLAQKARASGIHLLIATQRPSAEVMPPLIRSNIPTRLGLKVDNAASSGIILGEVPEGMLTADQLKGRGDTIYKDSAGEFMRLQAPFITDEDMHDMLNYLKEKYEPTPFVDYKTIVVEDKTGRVAVEWVEDYDEDVAWEDKKVKKGRRQRR